MNKEIWVLLMKNYSGRGATLAAFVLTLSFIGTTTSEPVGAAIRCPVEHTCVLVSVDNQNVSVPASGKTLYLTVFGGGQPATLVAPDGVTHALKKSIPFSDLVPPAGSSAQFSLQMLTANPFASGRLYFSEQDLGGNQPPAGASYRYDYVEFTIISQGGVTTVNGDVTGIDQVGIPAQLQFQNGHGTTLNIAGSTTELASRSMGCWTEILSTMAQSPVPDWDSSSVEITSNGNRIRIAGPSNMPRGIADYPSMQGYVASMAGESVRVRGYFGGNTALALPSAYYNYSGTFDTSGNLALSGTFASTQDGTSSASYPTPKNMYLPARAFFDAVAPNGMWDKNTWGGASGYGTGFGVYAQNGPYQVGGVKPAEFETLLASPGGLPTQTKSWALNPAYLAEKDVFFQSVGNDIYGWIYGDLIASMGNGFLGPLGYDTSTWNTNANRQGVPYASPQKAFADLHSSATPTYAAWNVFQQAIATTSDSYGMSLGDRFEFSEAKSSSPDMATDQQTNVIAITLLPNDGCATPVRLGPSPQSLLLSTDPETDTVIVLPAGQQPPEGVYHDYVTPTAFNFTPTLYTLNKMLPAGLTLNPTNGVVSGTATTAMKRRSYTLTATDGTRTATMPFYLTVVTTL